MPDHPSKPGAPRGHDRAPTLGGRRASGWLVLTVLALTLSCGPWTSDQGSRGGTDTETIYTGRPGEFYIIDRTRRLCFFYSIVYGRYVFAQVDCRGLPEAARFIDVDPSMRGGVSDGEPGLPPDLYTDEQWQGFHAAYLQISCERSQRSGVQLSDVLAIHDLDEAAYRAMLARASVDRDYWTSLSRDAQSSCVAAKPQLPREGAIEGSLSAGAGEESAK